MSRGRSYISILQPATSRALALLLRPKSRRAPKPTAFHADGYPVSCPWPAAPDRISVVERQRVARDGSGPHRWGVGRAVIARGVVEFLTYATPAKYVDQQLDEAPHGVSVLGSVVRVELGDGQRANARVGNSSRSASPQAARGGAAPRSCSQPAVRPGSRPGRHQSESPVRRKLQAEKLAALALPRGSDIVLSTTTTGSLRPAMIPASNSVCCPRPRKLICSERQHRAIGRERAKLDRRLRRCRACAQLPSDPGAVDHAGDVEVRMPIDVNQPRPLKPVSKARNGAYTDRAVASENQNRVLGRSASRTRAATWLARCVTARALAARGFSWSGRQRKRSTGPRGAPPRRCL